VALEDEPSCSGGENRCRNDDAGYANKFVHGICSEIAEL
jgi:hypothetical protein